MEQIDDESINCTVLLKDSHPQAFGEEDNSDIFETILIRTSTTTPVSSR